MTLSGSSYNLKDYEIFHNSKLYDYSIWIPDKTYIVIGRANNPSDSVNLDIAQKDNIPVLKRPSGGESVVLSPNTLVISVKITDDNSLKTHKYFQIINEQIISALQNIGVNNLNMKGISDISIGNLKILGSSIYRKKETIFYHAVLNVSEEIELIEKYLKHPKREPDYRNGRNHSEFVTSLKKEEYVYNLTTIYNSINNKLDGFEYMNRTY